MTYPDLSNNDPVYNMRAIQRSGHPAFVGKVNQGTGFVDSTYAPMVRSARAAGMAVGGYDFVQNYTASEAYLFIRRLQATGTCGGRGVIPPTLDVEFGAFSYSGVLNMLQILRRSCGQRVQIYTGDWYWAPHAGCRWPSGVIGWISGYPFAPQVCGLQAGLYQVHQYTDHGFNGVLSGDMNVYNGTRPQFPAFAGLGTAKPARHHDHARDQQHLHALYRQRTQLRAQLTQTHCRSRHTTGCLALQRRGNAVNGEILALRKRGAR